MGATSVKMREEKAKETVQKHKIEQDRSKMTVISISPRFY